jgi:hypothetical protein
MRLPRRSSHRPDRPLGSLSIFAARLVLKHRSLVISVGEVNPSRQFSYSSGSLSAARVHQHGDVIPGVGYWAHLSESFRLSTPARHDGPAHQHPAQPIKPFALSLLVTGFAATTRGMRAVGAYKKNSVSRLPLCDTQPALLQCFGVRPAVTWCPGWTETTLCKQGSEGAQHAFIWLVQDPSE